MLSQVRDRFCGLYSWDLPNACDSGAPAHPLPAAVTGFPAPPARDHTWKVHRPYHWRKHQLHPAWRGSPASPSTMPPSLVMSSLISAAEPLRSDRPCSPASQRHLPQVRPASKGCLTRTVSSFQATSGGLAEYSR